MPTALLINGLTFFFPSNENKEPAHVYVTKGNADGKIWLEPALNVAYMHGFHKWRAKRYSGNCDVKL